MSQSDDDDRQELTRDHVRWAYRLFLDREPESETVVEEKLLNTCSTQELRRVFMISTEFGLKNPELTLFQDSHVVIKQLADNLRIYIDLADSVIGWNIIRGDYEAAELDFARRTIEPGQTVVDVGANIGVFTITMASLVGPTGKVYAFEPHEPEAKLLTKSLVENNFTDRVVLERTAVSDQCGKGQLVSAAQTINAGGAYLSNQAEQVPADHETNEVEVITLDTYPLKRPVSFIKIDVEGAELLALRGATNLLSEDRPLILSELHPTQLQKVSGCTPTEFITTVEQLGYDCHDLHGAELTSFKDEGAKVKSVVFLPRT
jgi:FkbM family methyltransferase